MAALKEINELLNKDDIKSAFVIIEEVWNNNSKDGGKSIPESNLSSIIFFLCDRFGISPAVTVSDIDLFRDEDEGDKDDYISKELFILKDFGPILKAIRAKLEE